MKQILNKIKKGKFNNVLAIISLFIAISSAIFSWQALRVSKDALDLNIEPNIKCSIKTTTDFEKEVSHATLRIINLGANPVYNLAIYRAQILFKNKKIHVGIVDYPVDRPYRKFDILKNNDTLSIEVSKEITQHFNSLGRDSIIYKYYERFVWIYYFYVRYSRLPDKKIYESKIALEVTYRPGKIYYFVDYSELSEFEDNRIGLGRESEYKKWIDSISIR